MQRSGSGPARTPEFASRFHQPSAFEVATSWVHGAVPFAAPLPEPAAATPRAAFEDAIKPALAEPPCFVTFSGGRDSSAILAVATHLARTEGMPDPVPVTEIYPGIDDADESEWQRLVIDHLGLSEWIRIPYHGENDLLGPAAQSGLLRRGLVWPPTFQVKDTLLASMSGGSMVTGEGGDEVVGVRRVTPLTLLLRKRRRPSRALLAACALSLSPALVRQALLSRSLPSDCYKPWLRPWVRRAHLRRLAADDATEPFSWEKSTWWLRNRRAVAVIVGNYEALGAEHGVSVHHPFLDDGFLAAVAHAGGRWGYAGRTALMRILFADLLPDEVLRRASKASFDQAFMGAATREFARGWDGTGVDPQLVDPEILRDAWRSDDPSTLSAMLLQSAWLAGQPARSAKEAR